MCKILHRVYRCGHYTATLVGDPCEEAVRNSLICDPPKILDQTTALVNCAKKPICDEKAGLKREGPGKLVALIFYLMH
ncbi:hypothetical protein BDW69DRAFT_176618 [Aspergillus filifer]